MLSLVPHPMIVSTKMMTYQLSCLMRNNLLSMQKELGPDLLSYMKAGEDRSEQVVDSAMLGK